MDTLFTKIINKEIPADIISPQPGARSRQPHPRVYELDGLKLLDLEDATVEIAVRIGLTTASRRLRSATRK